MAAGRISGTLSSKGDVAMKRLAMILGLAVVLFAGVGFAADSGAAFAEHPNGAFADVTNRAELANAPHPAPAGGSIIAGGPEGSGAQGAIHGFGFTFREGGPAFGVGDADPNNPAVIGIAHNPNCPLHWPVS